MPIFMPEHPGLCYLCYYPTDWRSSYQGFIARVIVVTRLLQIYIFQIRPKRFLSPSPCHSPDSPLDRTNVGPDYVVGMISLVAVVVLEVSPVPENHVCVSDELSVDELVNLRPRAWRGPVVNFVAFVLQPP